MRTRLLISMLVFVVAACADRGTNGSVTFRFEDSEGASFFAITSDTTVIAKARGQLALPIEQRNLHIDGKIGRGDDGHNKGWSWHYQRNMWDVVEISIELCDGTCRMVEDDLDYWIDTVGAFCPWSSHVVEEMLGK